MEDLALAVKEKIETPFDRRSLFIGGGVLAAFAAAASAGSAQAFADDGGSGEAIAAAIASSGAAASSSSESSGGGDYMAGSSSELRSGMLAQSGGSTPEWNLADDEITDDILDRLAAAEAENAQLRSDVDTLLGLLTSNGTLPREVYVQTSAGATVTVDTYPALLVGADMMLYSVTEG